MINVLEPDAMGLGEDIDRLHGIEVEAARLVEDWQCFVVHLLAGQQKTPDCDPSRGCQSPISERAFLHVDFNQGPRREYVAVDTITHLSGKVCQLGRHDGDGVLDGRAKCRS